MIGLTPIWWDGASSTEVWAFALSVCTCGGCRDNPPDGSAIPTMTNEEIRHHLTVASRFLATTLTCWLERYTRQLLTEQRRRAGL